MVQVKSGLTVSDFACVLCREAAVNHKGDLTYVDPCGHLLCWGCFERAGSPLRSCPCCSKTIRELTVLPAFLRGNPLLKPRKKNCPDCKTKFLGREHFEYCPERKAVFKGSLVAAAQVLDLVAKVNTSFPGFGPEAWRFDFSGGDKIVFDFVWRAQAYRMILFRFQLSTVLACLTIGPRAIHLELNVPNRPPIGLDSRCVTTKDGTFTFTGHNKCVYRLSKVTSVSIFAFEDSD